MAKLKMAFPYGILALLIAILNIISEYNIYMNIITMAKLA